MLSENESELESVICGVLQGSVMGTLLFICLHLWSLWMQYV